MAGAHAPLVICEGWRFLPQSFAIVNQFQILALLDLGLSVAVADRPFYSDWQPIHGVLPDALEERLKSLGAPPEGATPAALFRVSFPYDFSAAPDVPTLVMMTSETGTIGPERVMGAVPLTEAVAASAARIHAPSRWSRDGLVASGIPPHRIAVIGHGVATDWWRPADEAARAEIRGRLGWQNDFALLNIGVMSENKGIDLLLAAFAAILEVHPRTRLVLKGIDGLYRSRDLAQRALGALPAGPRERVASRLTYVGGSLTMDDMIRLYQAADAYVSPYRAEGFNMPVLEAAACGLPVVCTAGGATDDFTAPGFALRIDAAFDEAARSLSPSLDHLIAQMRRCIEDDAWRQGARAAGPAFAAEGHTWRHVAQKLLRAVGLEARE